MNRLFVSTVGTSLLTGWAASQGDKAAVGMLRDTANAREQDLSAEQKQAVDAVAARVSRHLAAAKDDEVRRRSAELNGIYRYYGDELHTPAPGTDIHCLMATDTYQGRATAGIIEDKLRALGVRNIQIIIPPKMNTADSRSFHLGMSEVVKWCEEVLPPYRDAGYHVVFNLVGGFKSIQGYMNTLGMFYADEIIYIFEAAEAGLIRIPRLPVELVELPVLREKTDLFLCLEYGDLASAEDVRDIPELFLEKDGSEHTLSEWGLFIWQRKKAEVLESRTALMPFKGLVYDSGFAKDFADADSKLRCKVHDTLARVSCLYRSGGLESLRKDGGLQYETFAKFKEDKIGHLRLDQARRLWCRPEGDSLRIISIRHHNDNP